MNSLFGVYATCVGSRVQYYWAFFLHEHISYVSRYQIESVIKYHPQHIIIPISWECMVALNKCWSHTKSSDSERRVWGGVLYLEHSIRREWCVYTVVRLHCKWVQHMWSLRCTKAISYTNSNSDIGNYFSCGMNFFIIIMHMYIIANFDVMNFSYYITQAMSPIKTSRLPNWQFEFNYPPIFFVIL